MAHSGTFRAESLGDGWNGYERLARLCELARLTNRQAQVTLLFCRGCDYGDIQGVLGVPWKEVWRSLHVTNEKLERTFPRLLELMALLRSGESEQANRLFGTDPRLARFARGRDRNADAVALYEAYRGPRRSTGRGPALAVDPVYKQVYQPSLHPQLVTVAHFGGTRSKPGEWLMPIDLVPALLEEMTRTELAPVG